MPVPEHLDQDLLQKLLLGRLPSSEVERLAREYVNDDRLSELAESVVGTGDTLLELLHNHETVADPEGEQLVERLLVRLRLDLSQHSLAGSGAVHLNDLPIDGEALTDTGMAHATPTLQQLPGWLEYYRLIKVLGQGGMGTVYLAEDTRLEREVAIKTLRPDLAMNADARERFLREARAAAKLEHDHIIPIYAVGEADGMPFLAMPLLKGESLDALIRRTGGPLPVAVAVRVAREVAMGLAVAHERGLIHRDIKPANIWLEAPSGRVKILDFGLAKAADTDNETDRQPALTASGAIVGTPAYMAPEQASECGVDARSDLFSLGCLLYEMLSGKRAFSGPNTMSILMKLAVQTPPAPDELSTACPAGLSRLVMNLLEKDPAKRLASARDVIAALDDSGYSKHLSSLMTPLPQTPASQPVANVAEPAVIPQHPPPVRPAAQRGRTGIIVTVCLLFAAAVGILFSGQIVRVINNKGELVVEIDDPTIEIRIKQPGLEVQDPTTKRKFELKAVNGQIEVLDHDGLKLLTQAFELNRGGVRKIKVTAAELIAAREAAKHPDTGPSSTPAAAPLADKENPFVLVQSSGKHREEFQTLGGAIGATNDGDIIEVQGNGPFVIGRVVLRDKGLRLRAAAGYRPRIVTSKTISGGYHWFHIENGVLEITGCDLYCGPVPYGSFSGSGPHWEFRNCRILGGDSQLIGYRGPKLRFIDCLISGFTPPGNEGFGPAEVPGALEMTNTIIRTSGYHLLQTPCDIHAKTGNWDVKLQHNTMLISGALAMGVGRKEWGKMKIEAADNLLQVIGVANPKVLKEIGGWAGRDNLYVGPDAFAGLPPEPGGTKPTVKSWSKFWGENEQNGQQAEWAWYAWDEVRRKGQEPEGVIKGLAPVTAEIAKKQGKAFVDLGPQWDIVGPGDAYVNALAAAGKAVDKDQLKPSPLSEGSFVLLRNGKVVKAFATPDQAVANAEDNDTVEIRTDNPVGRITTTGDKKRQITLRAAPGYRPVVDGGLWLESKNLSLVIEGLHFKAPIGAGFGGHPTEVSEKNSIARLANCSFSNDLVFYQYTGRWPVNGINGPRFRSADGSGAEIVNCIIPGVIGAFSYDEDKLAIRNSVISNLRVQCKSSGRRNLDLDRCIVWNPCADHAAIQYGTPDPEKIKVQLAISTSKTLFEPGPQFISLFKGVELANWSGQANVYRMGHRCWLNMQDAPGPVTALKEWALRWKSDADSIEAEPVEYDPQQWRLLPGSPGYQAGPNGEDLGADVSRIGTIVQHK